MSIKSWCRFVDQKLTAIQLRTIGEKNALLSFLFHTLFEDEAEMQRGQVAPILGITVAQFQEFVEYYHAHGYTFVSPDEILNGLPAGKFVLITFDDGYYNNFRARPILEKFQVPALFFISTGHVMENKAYWWDVAYRETIAQGKTNHDYRNIGNELKALRHDELEARMRERFSDDCLNPVGDLDRPMNPHELIEFASHDLVHIGNHTRDHALLTNYDTDGVQNQISLAQSDLHDMLGKTPDFISYPNGFYTPTIGSIAHDLGLKMGITTVNSKTPVPFRFRGTQHMELGRFMPGPTEPLPQQLFNCRSDVHLVRRVRSLFGKGTY